MASAQLIAAITGRKVRLYLIWQYFFIFYFPAILKEGYAVYNEE